MLILLPPSDAKALVTRGKPLDPAALSFPSLAPTRAAVLDAVIELSADEDATRRLGERASMAEVVRRNVDLFDAPAAAVENVYSGVLYAAIGLDALDPAARRRARAWIVVISALWGAVRFGDRIPPYRLDMCARLPGLGHLTDVWREPLDDVLPALAGSGLLVDCRSAGYATAWRPRGVLVEQTVIVKVLGDESGARRASGHAAKWARGLLVRRILTDAIDAPRPEGLAEALGEHFDVDLHRPPRPGRPWELRVVGPSA